MLCNTCQAAFRQFRWYESGILLRDTHHMTLEQLSHSAEIGCYICSILQERCKVLAYSLGSTSLVIREGGGLVSCFLYKLSPTSGNAQIEEFHIDFHLRIKHVGIEIPEEERAIRFFLVPPKELDGSFKESYDISNSTDSMTAFALTKHWLGTCLESHENCKTVDESDWMPSRLLFIGSSSQGDKIHLCHPSENAVLPEPYATLSHCWGGQPTMKLLRTNLESRTKAIDLLSLPKTFRDAVKLIQYLEIRFIWIDALCIIQDSDEDWRKESLLMNKVYKHSTLNIAASDSHNSNGGCFFVRDPNLRPETVNIIQGGGTWISCLIVQARSDLSDIFEDGPLYKRAWVLQERTLPSRILHCGRTQLTWQCRETVASEAYPKGRPLDQNSRNRQMLWRLLAKPQSLRQIYTHTSMVELDHTVLNLWRALVQIYSNCSLTQPSDKLMAIAGLALGMQPILGNYVAGLWEIALHRDLLWVTQAPIPGDPTPRRSRIYRAPSWSWASIDGRIEYQFPGSIGIDPVSSIEKVRVIGSMGEVTSGLLHIRGKIRAARLVRDEGTSYDIDEPQNEVGSETIILTAQPYSEETYIDDETDLDRDPDDMYVLPISRRSKTAGYVALDYICLILRQDQLGQHHRIGLCSLRITDKTFEAWSNSLVEIH